MGDSLGVRKGVTHVKCVCNSGKSIFEGFASGLSLSLSLYSIYIYIYFALSIYISHYISTIYYINLDL